jgi:hypothetical protein
MTFCDVRKRSPFSDPSLSCSQRACYTLVLQDHALMGTRAPIYIVGLASALPEA